MKIKLGIVFLILSIVTVAGVFYLKDYISYDVKRPETSRGRVQTIEPLVDVKAVLTDYSDKAYADQIIQDRVRTAYDQGDMMIVHFWASWCAPCVNEIPEIVQFMKKNKAENKKIQFIAVNLDSGTAEISKFLKSFPEIDKEPFIRIWDRDNFLSKYYNVDKLPASIFLQKDKPYRRTNGAVDWLRGW